MSGDMAAWLIFAGMTPDRIPGQAKSVCGEKPVRGRTGFFVFQRGRG